MPERLKKSENRHNTPRFFIDWKGNGGIFVNEKGLQILEQYDITLLRSFGGRGAIMLETEQGLKILKEFAGSRTKLPFEQSLLKRLEEEQICEVDRVVPNLEGELVSIGDYETLYLMKNWPSGRECDVRSEEDLLKSMRMLARIHRAARGVWRAEGEDREHLMGTDRREELDRHNRELKRVRNFIRGKHKKGDFERLYLKYAEGIIQEGEKASLCLKESGYEKLYQRACMEEHICHGEYIHHNILMNRQETAVVNFQRCEINVQVNDICLFLRKIMEKQNWNENLAARMLGAYEKELPLSGEEERYLAVCLYYPEKVWKLANHYFHTNKAWIPEKSAEKLEIFLDQEEQRKKMIRNMLKFA